MERPKRPKPIGHGASGVVLGDDVHRGAMRFDELGQNVPDNFIDPGAPSDDQAEACEKVNRDVVGIGRHDSSSETMIIRPGDNFHGFLTLGNSAELAAAFDGVTGVSAPPPDECIEAYRRRCWAVIQDYLDQAVSSENGKNAGL